MVSGRVKLAEADRERLARAIKDAEARTAAELVLVVADACGGYGAFAFLWPAMAALLAGGAAAVAMPELAAPRLFLVEAVVFVALAAVLQWPPALMRVVPPQIRRAHTLRLAEYQFALRVEGRTPARTGLLLFLALAERQVLVLPDAGISAVIDTPAWRGVIDRLTAAMRAGPPVAAIEGAIAEIGTLLERHFPQGAEAAAGLTDEIVELPASSSSGDFA